MTLIHNEDLHANEIAKDQLYRAIITIQTKYNSQITIVPGLFNDGFKDEHYHIVLKEDDFKQGTFVDDIKIPPSDKLKYETTDKS